MLAPCLAITVGQTDEHAWAVGQLGAQSQVAACRPEAKLQQAVHQVRIDVAAADDRATGVPFGRHGTRQHRRQCDAL